MTSFPVEDDLIALVWKLSQPAPFETLTFSQALRRVLLKFGVSEASGTFSAQTVPTPIRRESSISEFAVREPAADLDGLVRAQKTSIRSLVRHGVLHEGDVVIFRDFRGTTYPDDKATVSGDALLYSDGRRYSMSSLAGLMLKKYGYKGDSVRGPIHWVNSENKTLWDLWEAAVIRHKRLSE